MESWAHSGPAPDPPVYSPHPDLTATWWPGGWGEASEMCSGWREETQKWLSGFWGHQMLLAADYLLSWERARPEVQVWAALMGRSGTDGQRATDA